VILKSVKIKVINISGQARTASIALPKTPAKQGAGYSKMLRQIDALMQKVLSRKKRFYVGSISNKLL